MNDATARALKDVFPPLRRWLTLVSLLGLLWPGSSLRAETRTFTSVDGKTLEAEVVSADASAVTLKLAAGGQTTVPLNRLGETDRQYVKDWVSRNPAAVRYNFNVAWEKETVGSRVGGGDKKIKITTSTYVVHFKITNRSGVPLENLDARLQVYFKAQSSKEPTTDHLDCVRKIPLIKAGETITVDSERVDIQMSELKAGYSYKGGFNVRQSGSIQGVALTLMHGDWQAHDYVSPGVKREAAKTLR